MANLKDTTVNGKLLIANNGGGVLDIEDSLSDTGWINLKEPAISGFILYRKKNGFVTITGQSIGDWDIGGATYRSNICSPVPLDCAPTSPIGFVLNHVGGEFKGQASYVDTDGKIQFYVIGDDQSYWRFSVTYPV